MLLLLFWESVWTTGRDFYKKYFCFHNYLCRFFLLLYFLEKVPLNETKETETETDDVKFTEEDEIETVEV